MIAPERRFIQVIGAFLLFSTAIALSASFTLLFPGTFLDRIWVVNPSAYQELLPFAKVAGAGFLLLAPLVVCVGYGLLRFRRWAWQLGIAGIIANALGDMVNLWRGEVFKGVFGLVIALAILLFLLSPAVRKLFAG